MVLQLALSVALIKGVMWVDSCPNELSFSMNKKCPFFHAPTMSHWTTDEKIVRYVKGNINVGLIIQKPHAILLTSFSNADWFS
jgi:hypothetical protein